MLKSCTVFSTIKYADGFDRFMLSVLISRIMSRDGPGHRRDCTCGMSLLFGWTSHFISVDALPLRGVFGRAQTAGHRLISAMWELVTCQDGVAFIVGPRVHPICNTEWADRHRHIVLIFSVPCAFLHGVP